jgi:hypothetical protein
MLKKIAFLVKRPELSVDRFERHWRDVHGPLVSRSPGYASFRRSYTQNHVSGTTAFGRPFVWSGMAEFELPDDIANEDLFVTTEIYRGRIAPDERRFIDMEATVSFTARHSVARAGRAPVKIVLVVRDRERGSSGLAAARGLAAAGGRILGWTVDEVMSDTFRRPGSGAPDAAPDIDAVHEVWFDDPDDVASVSAMLAEALEPHVDVARSWSFVARELVFFDQGQPQTP